MTRRRGAIAALVALITALLLPASANAAVGDLTCTGNFHFTFSPALTATNTTATANVGGGLVDCFSPNGSHPELKWGVRVGEGTVTRPIGTIPCAPIMTITEGAVLYWNTGQTSTFDITVNTNPLNGAITVSAYFTSGPLAGDTANAFPIILHPNLDCAINGMTALTSDLLQVFWD
jgi:hypothetical protein